MSDEEIIRACRDAGFTDKEWKAMTYQTGSYDITEPSVVLKNLCKIIADNENEKQQAIVDAAVAAVTCDPEGNEWDHLVKAIEALKEKK